LAERRRSLPQAIVRESFFDFEIQAAFMAGAQITSWHAE